MNFRKRNLKTIILFIHIFVFISYGFCKVIESPNSVQSTAMSLVDPSRNSDPRFLGLWGDPEFNMKLQLPFTDHPIGLSVDSSFTAGIIAAVIIILVTNAVTLTIISTISYFAHRWVKEKKDALLGPFNLIREHLSKKTLEVTQDFEKSMLLYRELAKKKARSKLRKKYKSKNSRKIDVSSKESESVEHGDSSSASTELEEMINIDNSTTISTTTPRSINSTTTETSTSTVGWLTKLFSDLLLGPSSDSSSSEVKIKNSTKSSKPEMLNTTTNLDLTTTPQPKLIPAKLIGISHKYRPGDPSQKHEYSGYYQIMDENEPGGGAIVTTTLEDAEKLKCLENKGKKNLIGRVFTTC